MRNTISWAVKTAIAGFALSAVSAVASAGSVGGTTLVSSAWANGDNILAENETIITSARSFGTNNSWTDNLSLNNSAWGHSVTWFQFQVASANQTVVLRDDITAGVRASAFTVWASGDTPFDGGTALGDETNAGNASGNTPHSFNAVGQLGSVGTLWAADPSYSNTVDNLTGAGNLQRTLAYVNAGNAHTDPNFNDWNEVIAAGINQVDQSGNYFTGSVTGSTGSNFAELIFSNLATGWYTVAIGGANSASPGNASHQFSVTSVAAVPLPGAAYLFGSALLGLAVRTRRTLRQA